MITREYYKMPLPPSDLWLVFRSGRPEGPPMTEQEAEAYIEQCMEEDDAAARYDAFGSPYAVDSTRRS